MNMTAPVSPWPSASRSWYAVIILTLAYVLSFVDRQILALLIKPIKEDLGLTDFQISLLIGPAFAICYTTFGIPIGWLVDRFNRRSIAATGVLFWSLMTGLCGLSNGYLLLFIARLGVGLGEAALTPASYSLLSDMFPAKKLVKAIAVYMSGAIIGISMAFLLGGLLASWAEANSSIQIPILGEIRGWHVPFILLTFPGILLSVFVFLINEPARRSKTDLGSPNLPVLPFLKQASPALIPLFLAMGAQSVVVYANLSWMPTLLSRTYGWDTATIGVTLAGVFLAAGLLGNFIGAQVGSWFLGRDNRTSFLNIGLFSGSCLFVLGPLVALATSPVMVCAILFVMILLTSLPTAIVPTAVQMVTPQQLRGQISAIYLFATQIIGLMFGPTIVAFMTDFVFADTQAIGLSQAASITLAGGLSAILIFLARLPFANLTAASR